MAEKREPGIGEVMRGAERGDPEMVVRAEEFRQSVQQALAGAVQAAQQTDARIRADELERSEHIQSMLTEAAAEKAEKTAREDAALEAVSKIRQLADEGARASERRERESARREALMMRITIVSAVLTALSVVVAVLAIILTV